MVEEDEYRSTYKAINRRRCEFEKAITSRHCSCVHATRFFLADREGVSCESPRMLENCKTFLQLLRAKAQFALKLTATSEILPHAKEIKVQNGGIQGLSEALHRNSTDCEGKFEIAGLIKRGEATYGSLENMPFQEIVKSVVSYEGRRRRPDRK